MTYTTGDRVRVILDTLNTGHVDDTGTVVFVVPEDPLPYRVRLDQYAIVTLCFSAEELARQELAS